MPETRSALLSVLGLSFDEIDVADLAAKSGVAVVRLSQQPPKVAEIVAAQPLADGPAFVEGSGDSHFDAVVAAALGIPLVIVARGDSRAAMLAERHAKDMHATVAGVFSPEQISDERALRRAVNLNVKPVMSAPVFEHNLLEQAKKVGAHVVLPEVEDDRILLAAGAVLDKGVAKLTLLGEPEALELHDATLLDHVRSALLEEYAQKFAQLRKSKCVTIAQARETMKEISYFATMMVHCGAADGMVSGAAHTTAHTIKPSFQIIKTVPDASVVSSIFLMVMRGRLWAFGDCAVNPNPTAEQLGEIAVVSARTAKQFGIDPRVAMLSYSTGTSGAGPDVERATAAVASAKAIDPQVK